MKKTLVAIVFVLGLVLIVTNAQAAIITPVYGDTSYVGLINDGIPSSGADELVYVTNLITLAAGAGNTVIGTEIYNRIDSTVAPLPPVVAFLGKDETGPLSWTVGTNDPFYVLGKYAAGNAGSWVWLVDGSIGDTVTLPATFGQFGLSHISAFSTTTISIPEAGALLMFGTGLVGLVVYRRRKRMMPDTH